MKLTKYEKEIIAHMRKAGSKISGGHNPVFRMGKLRYSTFYNLQEKGLIIPTGETARLNKLVPLFGLSDLGKTIEL